MSNFLRGLNVEYVQFAPKLKLNHAVGDDVYIVPDPNKPWRGIPAVILKDEGSQLVVRLSLPNLPHSTRVNRTQVVNTQFESVNMNPVIPDPVSKVFPVKIVTQNVDRAILKKDFDNFESSLLVTSFFRTVQGEGPFSGHPAIFLRLAGCNFGAKDHQCTWCDTSFQFNKGTTYGYQALIDALLALPGYSKHDILVVTGGEPTLQQNLLSLIVLAAPHFANIQIETNGTQASFFNEAENRGMTSLFKTVVSPKANYKAGRYALIPAVVRWYASCLKFVVDADPDSPHHTIPDWALDRSLVSCPVYVSPMAVYSRPYEGEVSSVWEEGLINKEATARNYNYAAEYAMKHNLLLSLQTHLFIGLA